MRLGETDEPLRASVLALDPGLSAALRAAGRESRADVAPVAVLALRPSRSTRGEPVPSLIRRHRTMLQWSMKPRAYVYILASRRNGTLYVGSTTDLARRIFEYKQKSVPGFTSRYDVVLLVWYEAYDRFLDARHREYAIKRWKRAWKLELIESVNPTWRDLYWDLNQ